MSTLRRNLRFSASGSVSVTRMLMLAWLAGQLLGPTLAWAMPYEIDGTMIEIPDPPQFVPVTPQMALAYHLQTLMATPKGDIHALYIAESEVTHVLQRNLANLRRRLTIETHKDMVGHKISDQQFSTTKRQYRAYCEDSLAQIKKQVPSLAADFGTVTLASDDINKALKHAAVVPLFPHYETDQAIAFSAFMRINPQDASDNALPPASVATATFVHVKDKVIHLYAYTSRDDLAWSRTVSAQWATDILQANAPGTYIAKPPVIETPTIVEPAISWTSLTLKVIGVVIIISIFLMW